MTLSPATDSQLLYMSQDIPLLFFLSAGVCECVCCLRCEREKEGSKAERILYNCTVESSRP